MSETVSWTEFVNSRTVDTLDGSEKIPSLDGYVTPLSMKNYSIANMGCFNVKDYGATGDGTTNDRGAIMSAIAAAGLVNGVVYFPSGTYLIETALSFGTNTVKLEGVGMGKSVIKASPTFSAFAMIYDFTSGLSDVEICGLTFDANNVNGKGVIEFGTCNNMYIHDNEFMNVSSPTTSHWTILIGRIVNGSEDASASYNVNFYNNYVHDNDNGTNETILPINCRNSRFDNNYFLNNDNTAYTLNLFGYCYNSTVLGNIFRNCRDNIYVLSCENVIVANNIGYAEALSQNIVTISNSQYVTVTGNVNRGYRSGGLAAGGIDILDRAGTFDGHDQLFEYSRFITIDGNQISECYYGITVATGTGIYNKYTARDINIINNQIYSAEYQAISIGIDDATVDLQDIVIENNYVGVCNVFDHGAITVRGYSSDITKVKNISINNNKVLAGSRTNSTGIELEYVSNITVNNNDLLGTDKGTLAGQPIYVVGGSTIRTAVNNIGVNPQTRYAQGNVTGATTFTRANGSTITATATGNVTTTITDGVIAGDILTLIITQDATGSRTISKPSNVKLVGGAFSPTATANAVDSWTLQWNGSSWVEVSRSLNVS